MTTVCVSVVIYVYLPTEAGCFVPHAHDHDRVCVHANREPGAIRHIDASDRHGEIHTQHRIEIKQNDYARHPPELCLLSAADLQIT